MRFLIASDDSDDILLFFSIQKVVYNGPINVFYQFSMALNDIIYAIRRYYIIIIYYSIWE